MIFVLARVKLKFMSMMVSLSANNVDNDGEEGGGWGMNAILAAVAPLRGPRCNQCASCC